MLDKYKLGIDIIDKQHQKIFDLIDNVCEKSSKTELKKIINELKEYSLYHFKTEEEYFKKINFKYSNKHVELHNMFIETIQYYYENPEKVKKAKIYNFLKAWIETHILIEDKKYTIKENINA